MDESVRTRCTTYTGRSFCHRSKIHELVKYVVLRPEAIRVGFQTVSFAKMKLFVFKFHIIIVGRRNHIRSHREVRNPSRCYVPVKLKCTRRSNGCCRWFFVQTFYVHRAAKVNSKSHAKYPNTQTRFWRTCVNGFFGFRNVPPLSRRAQGIVEFREFQKSFGTRLHVAKHDEGWYIKKKKKTI